MTGSNPPPDGNERPAPSLRPALRAPPTSPLHNRNSVAATRDADDRRSAHTASRPQRPRGGGQPARHRTGSTPNAASRPRQILRPRPPHIECRRSAETGAGAGAAGEWSRRHLLPPAPRRPRLQRHAAAAPAPPRQRHARGNALRRRRAAATATARRHPDRSLRRRPQSRQGARADQEAARRRRSGAADFRSHGEGDRRGADRTEQQQPHQSAQPAHRDRARHGRSADAPLGQRASSAGRHRQRRHQHFRAVGGRVGVVLFVGKQRFEQPGPLAQDTHRQYPARAPACATSPMSCSARRRDRPALGVHRRRARAQGARGSQGRRISVQGACQPARRRRDHGRGQGRRAPGQHSGRSDLRADRRAPVGRRRSDRRHQGNSARGQPAAGYL